MKAITIDSRNCNRVFSKLEKFFAHDEFCGWHQWDTGMKKRIGHHVKSHYGDYKHDVMRLYRGPFTVKRLGNRLVINMSWDEGFVVGEGDKVAFLGNRIMIRTKQTCFDYQYLYQVFQINK